MKKIQKLFDWGWFKFGKCLLGLLINSIAINLFIVPNHFYIGGVLGSAQLIRSAIVAKTGITFPFDISSLIYYVFNIPLFLFAYKDLSKKFFIRTLFAVTFNTIFLAIMPIPQNPLVQNVFANVVIGGVLSGIGIGMILSTGSSTGGTDIIGISISKRSKSLSVGNINLVFNTIIYAICGIFYGVETMIYSIMISIFESFSIDRHHSQNISSETFIFTKKNPNDLIRFINTTLKRGATYWDAVGGYTKTKTTIVYTVLSKYERMRLERHMDEFDPDAFMVGDDGVKVIGDFTKYLV